MTDIKHTPGPWEYRSRELDDWGVVRADGFVICQARDKKGMSDVAQSKHRADGTDPFEANARLISAAPDMYEALANLENDDGRCMPASAWELVQNALAKARGG